MKWEDVINDVDCGDVKEREAVFLLVAEGKNQFIVSGRALREVVVEPGRDNSFS